MSESLEEKVERLEKDTTKTDELYVEWGTQFNKLIDIARAVSQKELSQAEALVGEYERKYGWSHNKETCGACRVDAKHVTN